MSLGTLVKSAVLIIVMLSVGSPVHAGTITYTEQATASGSLGSTPFSNALVTITFTGDTANVTGGSGFFTNTVGTATVNIFGIGPASVTSSLEVFDNQTFAPTAAAGIALNGGGSILDTFNSAFASYALATSIGPITGGSFINLTASTNLGTFSLSSAGDSTFTAATGVPEPASFILLGIGIAGLIAYRRMRRQATA